MDQEALINLGLSKEEADIYLSLLNKGGQSASELSKSTKVKRTYIYSVSASLIKKGLISQSKNGKTTVFNPMSPDKLLTLAHEKKQKAEQAEQTLEAILPNLKTKYEVVDNKPVVTYYEGIEGIKKVFKDIYSPKDEPVYGCVDFEKSDNAVPSYIVNELIPLRIKNKVFAKSFIGKSELAKKVQSEDSIHLRESLLLDKNDYPLPAEIDVYEDKIAMLSFDKGKFVGLIIKNKDITTSLKSIFKLAFQKPKKS